MAKKYDVSTLELAVRTAFSSPTYLRQLQDASESKQKSWAKMLQRSRQTFDVEISDCCKKIDEKHLESALIEIWGKAGNKQLFYVINQLQKGGVFIVSLFSFKSRITLLTSKLACKTSSIFPGKVPV